MLKNNLKIDLYEVEGYTFTVYSKELETDLLVEIKGNDVIVPISIFLELEHIYKDYEVYLYYNTDLNLLNDLIDDDEISVIIQEFLFQLENDHIESECNWRLN
jgi:hypothetical protein